MPEQEIVENQIPDLREVLNLAIEQKKDSPNFYPHIDDDPISYAQIEASRAAMSGYEKRLNDWFQDPVNRGGNGVEGFVFEIIAAQTLANIFENNGVKVILAPAELDFICKSNRRRFPSCDILICEEYENGYIPLTIVDTTISSGKRTKIHPELDAADINLTGKRDFDMIIPQLDILNIGMDTSGQKFFNLCREKTPILKENLLWRLQKAYTKFENRSVRYKIERVFDAIE